MAKKSPYKFTMVFDEIDEVEVRKRIDTLLDEVTGKVVVRGNDIMISKIDDAFAFMMQASLMIKANP